MRRRLGAVGLAGVVAIGLIFALAWFRPPGLSRLLVQSRQSFGRHGHVIATFEDARGEWKLPSDAATVDPLLARMVIAVEDRHFYLDPGVDPLSILRASAQLLAAGHVVSGASTLTMQVTRLLHPAPRTLAVKLDEAFHALALNEHYSKAAILGMWLSLAPFGGNLVGVEAASHAWFGHGPQRLSPAEAALLVALCRRPAALDPAVHPRAAMAARNRVLAAAAAAGVISGAALRHAEARAVPGRRHRFMVLAPQVTVHLPAGARTTIDGPLDAAIARFAHGVMRGLGPHESLAIMVVDARSRAIRAIYAGDWGDARRAGFVDLTRAVRSPGSALKPFLYGLAFADGLARPDGVLTDLPGRFGGYAPDDYTGRFKGAVTATTALRRSLNVPAVALMRAYGPQHFATALAAAGVPLALPRGAAPSLPLALGGAGITMRRLMALYAGLATDGRVERLHVLAGEARRRRRLLSPAIAQEITGILTRPFPGGGPAGIAWKTGTSAGNRDNWAFGYDRDTVVGVWIGAPDGGALAGQFALAALPVLADVFGFLPAAPLALPRSSTPPVLAEAKPALPFALLSPAPKLVLPAGDPVDLRAMGGARPLRFMIDDRLIASIPALRSAEWQPPGPGFYRLTIMDATGRTITGTVHVR